MSAASPEEIQSHLEYLESSSSNIERQITEICYHMNGGITWTEAWILSPQQRNNVIEFLNKLHEKASGKENL